MDDTVLKIEGTVQDDEEKNRTVKSAETEEKPAENGKQSAVKDDQPAENGEKTEEVSEKPVDGEQSEEKEDRSVENGDQPAENEEHPAEKEEKTEEVSEKPVDSEQSVEKENRSVENGEQPAENEEHPAEKEDKPADNDESKEKSEDSSDGESKEKSEDSSDEESKEKDADKDDEEADKKNEDNSADKTEDKSDEKALDEDSEDKPYVDKAAFESVKKKKHIVRNIFISLAGLLVIFYGVMTYLSYKYFAPGTRINGTDYSLRSYDYVLDHVNTSYDDYELRIRFRDGDEIFNKDEAGLIVTAEKDIKKIKKKQNPFLWFTYLWSENNVVDFEFDCDQDKLMNSIANSRFLSPEKMKSPEEPEVVFDKKTGHAMIVPGDSGTLLNKFDVYFLCRDAVKGLRNFVDVKNSGCYAKPKYSEDSPRLINMVNRINHYLDARVTYLYGNVKIEISPENIYSLLHFSDDYWAYLSKSKVRDFVEQISEEYDTFGTERMFKTHSGRIYKIGSEEYGYQMDVDKEAEMLFEEISNCDTIEREPEFLRKGYSYDKPHDDIGGNYAEVDLSKQKVYLYAGGKLALETDCVSGDINEGHRTPGGLYDVDALYKNVVLKGPGYASPVSYWMPFTSDIGFHDATWRSRFGEDIYTYNGSHGCVNLPLDDAETMFQIIELGYPVILYWEDELYR